MYPQLLTYLMEFIKHQDQVIRTLLTLLIGKGMFDKPEKTPVNKPYRKLQVDDLPIIETLQKLDYRVLTFVVDGNPIYLLAQHFFAQHDIHFDIKQVIGLTNEDPVSTEYRPLKQVIERLNRTFKGNYRSTHGFGSEHGSVSFVTLFVAYFNFLRPHAALEGKVPVVNPELLQLPNMPARWSKLIGLAQDWIIEQLA
ncbi:DDE-type integrase/transposase/recombinase [Neobacillus sp. YIM B02564]|uniref:DDE-type integrase/transposase/recombinase n=1 Tax=Neobacillus paridis TaxID=2803862 RepID=A0ABS1TR18_9BACI|nr:DDE-type integrase/transposase/recombinase [Neobacillus paridis]